ncbi:unnamed protein product [Nesidiocoris tenuis]|uniref:Uncharacterized protein n=1 Tax=Nesidiocoris tenuis TaxID=355587 RepID=A0A6H5H2T9_9HEMI|nr:unnamed protein product [Nesidiocoris tenuis]
MSKLHRRSRNPSGIVLPEVVRTLALDYLPVPSEINCLASLRCQVGLRTE